MGYYWQWEALMHLIIHVTEGDYLYLLHCRELHANLTRIIQTHLGQWIDCPDC